MNKIKFKLIPLFIILINGIIIAMTMESGYYITDFQFGSLWPYLVLPVLMVLGIIGVFQGQGNSFKVSFFLLALISGFFIYRLVDGTDFWRIPDDIQAINNTIRNNNLIKFQDFQTTIQLIMLVSSTLLAVTLYIFPYNLVILDGGLLIFLWIVDYNRNSYEYVRYFIPVWTFSILTYRASIRDENRKNLRVNHKRRIINALGFTLIISVASLFINVEAKGIYSDRLRAYFTGETMTNTTLGLRNLEDVFNLRQTGYNNSNTRLGGDITINEEEVLRGVGDPIVYLRGNVKTTYTGSEWLWEDRSFEEENRITEDKIRKFETLSLDQPLKQMEIRPTKQITSSLFHSLYTKEVIFSNNIAKVFYDEVFDTFTGNKTVVNDYLVTYYDETLLAEATESSSNSGLGLEPYLSLSETITDRTVDLVNSLVTDSMTNGEKARVLTAYLKDNYNYTLTPGELEEGDDFVDDFLFETQEGYCVYFGTALTVMLRIAGVPSRYVEGFKMGNEQIGGAYIVRNSDAHAWTEVLVDEENNLWETFDATGTPREMIFGEETLEETPTEEPQTPIDEEEENPQTPDTPEDNPVEEEEKTPLTIPAALIGVLALGLGILMRILYKKRYWERLYHEQSLKPYFKEMNKALDGIYYHKTLDGIYYHKTLDETYKEFGRRINDDELRQYYLGLVQEVYKEEYGGEIGEFGQRRELHDYVYDMTKEYRGVTYAFLKKYIL